MRKEYLYTPGPVAVPPEVLLKLAEPMYHHRSKRFQTVFSEVNEKLKQVFRTKNDIITFTASGTGAMEAAVVNFLSPGDKVITINGGKFGERWVGLAKAYGLAQHEVKITWGTAPDPEEIGKLLAADSSIKAVYTQLVETSTGTLYDVQALGAVVAKTPAIFVVDAISGMGADDLPVDAWQVDVCVVGSQKALMIPPGLSFMSVSEKAWAMAEKATLPKYYFDARKARKLLAKNDTPYTPAHTLIGALNVSLDMILKEGIEAVVARHARLAAAVRAGVAALNLPLYSKRPANALTAVETPGMDAEVIKKELDKDGILVAGGQDEAKGKIIRIAMMGYANEADVMIALAGLEQVLQRVGYAFTPGAGVAAAQASLLKG
ncbi:MAG: alanine--glyoxylate aminotransferase family protein [bacterium]|nr:alanine--glyoxylate aminotransferase family protein [bacterium]